MRHCITFDTAAAVGLPGLVVWTVWFLLPPMLGNVWSAEPTAKPTWRQGISQWNGSGYDLPSNALPQPVIALPNPVSDSSPYTVPRDPGNGPKVNPYFELPGNESIPRELTLPTVMPREDPEFVLPSITTSDTASTGATENEPTLNGPLTNEPTKPAAKPNPVPDNAGADNKNPAKPEALPAPAKQEPAESKSDDASKSAASDGNQKIADKIAEAETTAEPAPLQTEVIRWYQYPMRWMRGWDSHAEFGLDGSDGNADTLAYQVGIATKRATDRHAIGMNINYRNATNNNITREDNGRFNLDYDYIFKDSPWSGFGKYGMEWDKFKAFDLRLWLNGGLGYYWIRGDDALLVTRFGAGASKEIGAPVDDWIPEAVFGIEAERQLTSRQKLKGRVDYFPAWEDFSDYRLVSDFAWEILLDGSENFSLRLAATDRYDSTPQGAKANDVYYSLLLLYKF